MYDRKSRPDLSHYGFVLGAEARHSTTDSWELNGSTRSPFLSGWLTPHSISWSQQRHDPGVLTVLLGQAAGILVPQDIIPLENASVGFSRTPWFLPEDWQIFENCENSQKTIHHYLLYKSCRKMTIMKTLRTYYNFSYNLKT